MVERTLVETLKRAGLMVDRLLTCVGMIIYYGLALAVFVVAMAYVIPIVEFSMYAGAILVVVVGLAAVIVFLIWRALKWLYST